MTTDSVDEGQREMAMELGRGGGDRGEGQDRGSNVLHMQPIHATRLLQAIDPLEVVFRRTSEINELC